jgi:hypothetical protein
MIPLNFPRGVRHTPLTSLSLVKAAHQQPEPAALFGG